VTITEVTGAEAGLPAQMTSPDLTDCQQAPSCVTCTAQLAVERLYVGPLMTALDMNGFSLTLLEVDRSRLELLDAPTEVCTRRKEGLWMHSR